MSDSTENFELIDQYLEGKLTGEEKLLFDQRMSMDTDFRDLVEAQSVVNEIIIGDELLNIRDQISSDLSTSSKSGQTKWWLAGFGLLLGFGIVAFLPTITIKLLINCLLKSKFKRKKQRK